MFGDLFGQMEEQQKALKEKLATIIVEADAGDGAVTVKANAAREVLNISINKDALDWDDVEQVEDLITVAVNLALEKAADKEAVESEKMLNDMLPPGLGGMFGS